MPVGPLHFAFPLPTPRPGGPVHARWIRGAAFATAVAAHVAVLGGLARPVAPTPESAPRLLITVPLAGATLPEPPVPTHRREASTAAPGSSAAPVAAARATDAASAASTAGSRVPARQAVAPALSAAPSTSNGTPAAAITEADQPLRVLGVPVALGPAPARVGWPVRVTRLADDDASPAPDAVAGRLDWDDGADAADRGWRIRLVAGEADLLAANGRWTAQGPATSDSTDLGRAGSATRPSAGVDPLTATLLVGMAIRGTPTLTQPDTVIDLPAAGGGRLRYRVVGAEQIEVAGAGRDALRLSRIDPPSGATSTLRELWLETAYAWLPLRFDVESDGRLWRVEAAADLPR